MRNRGSAPFDSPLIPIEIEDYDIIDYDIPGAEQEEEKKRNGKKRGIPLTKFSGDIPTLESLGRQGVPTQEYRQRWFEKHVLDRIAAETGLDRIPYAFCTPSGR